MSTKIATPASTSPASNTDLIGHNLIGCGYNVASGRIARTNSVITSKPLFDLSPVEQTVYVGSKGPYVVSEDMVFNTDFGGGEIGEATEVSTYEEVNHSFEVNLGISGEYGGFSGELSGCYSQSQTDTVERSFSFAKQYRRYYFYKLVLAGEAADWRAKLKPDVKSDIDGAISADALVQKYGTHFLRSGYFGAIWMYAQAISKYIATSDTTVTKTLEASACYDNVAIDGSGGDSTEYYTSESALVSNFFMETVGGTSTTCFESWEKSVNDGTWSLIAFDNQTDVSLQPLSVLVDPANTTRISEIETAIRNALPTYPTAHLRWQPHSAQEINSGDHEKQFMLNPETESHLVITGLAFKVDGSNLQLIYAKLLDLDTGATGWYTETNGQHGPVSAHDYETETELRAGHVLTGLEVDASESAMHESQLYGQVIDVKNVYDNAYIGRTVISDGNQSDPDDKYVPIDGNTKIIYGLKMGVYKGNVGALTLYFGTFMKP